MLTPYQALFKKEWIKLRQILWFVPIFLFYATADTYFTLNTIERVHEAFGLWTTLVSKEPPFFGGFQYIVFLGFIIGFFQMWPESQGKHIRLLFHMPLEPELMVGFMLAVGLGLMLIINILAMLLLVLVLTLFHLPWEVISSVLCAFAPFALLSFVSYVSVFAFCGSKKLGLQGLIIVSTLIFYTLLWGISGYNTWRESLHYYVFMAIAYVFVSFYTFLQSMGEPEKSPLFSLSRMVSLCVFAILFSAVLPGQYWRAYMPKSTSQRLYYSPVHKQFVRDQTLVDLSNVQQSKVKYSLENKEVLNKRELALALPTMHAENLLKWNMFPKQIDGKELTLQQIKYQWHYTSLSPRTIIKPPLMLEMMLESQPEGASLEAPTDVFRLAHNKMRIEFLRPTDGKIDETKSTAFTEALREKGFVFPIMAFGGNPNIRKLYDAGYIFVDAKGQIFQLQMVQGKALCHKVEGKVSEKIRHILVEENRREEFFAFVITDSKIYAIAHKPLALVALPLKDYVLGDSYFYMWADPLQKTFVQGAYSQREQGLLGQAFTPEFALLREYNLPMQTKDIENLNFYTRIAAALFPFRIVQRSPASTYRTFDVQFSKYLLITAMANMLCVIILAWILRRKNKRIFDFIFVGVFGLSALIILGIESYFVRWRREGG